MSRAIFLATLLLFLAPAAKPAVYRLIERNGDVVTERAVIAVSIPSNGVLIVVPDRIFSDTESAAPTPQRSTGPPRPTPARGNAVNASSTEPRDKGSRTGRRSDLEA